MATISAALAGVIEDMAARWQEMAMKGEVGQVSAFLTDLVDETLGSASYKVIDVVEQVTTSNDRNVLGLSSAIAQAIQMRTAMVAHMTSVGVGGAHAFNAAANWAQVDVAASVNGTALGILRVAGAATLSVNDFVYVANSPQLLVVPVSGYVASADTTTVPGSTIYHITVAAGGLGGDVNLAAFTVALGAHIFRSIDVLPAVPTTLATLLTFVDVLRQGHALHDADADLAAAWQWHLADEVGPHLPNLALPLTTLAECITVLTDLHAVYDAHIAEAAAHTTAGIGPTTVVDAANGNACTLVNANALPGDKVQWGIVSGGAGPKTGVTMAAGTGIITFTASAPPVSDMIVSYSLLRAV